MLTYPADIFDGTMVTLAFYTMLFFHPGPLLYSQPEEVVVEENKIPSSSISLAAKPWANVTTSQA